MLKDGDTKLEKSVAKPLFLALLTVIVMAAICLTATWLFGRERLQALRSRVVLEGSTVRASLESGLNTRIHLQRGLVAYIKSNPDLTQEEFADFAAALMTDDPTIRNLSVLQGTVISYVYPYLQNQAALGRDLAQVEGQRETVLKTMETEDPILTGPLPLVQGGQGIIIRMSIYPGNADGSKYYWGQASLVINAAALDLFANSQRYPDLLFALRHVDQTNTQDAVFWGSSEIFAAKPVLFNVEIPGGQWELAAIPARGWNDDDWLIQLLIIISIGFSLLAGLLVFILLFTRSRLKVMAYSDPLTALPNRAYFWEALQASAALAKREHRLICLCMLDLNGFKAVNDQYGHAAGDRLLTLVAWRLRSALRSADIISR
ncbi:MAG: sensor domain-containing diguanylate cyclase, partial [Spirochaetes bacterium]|nr:sensor domain-containing diguanylate cyclase [Spirochaetota bacterium]